MIKIAVIEDEHVIAQMYKIKLEAAGFEVLVASNGHDGYELIKNQRPDLVLLDLRMPEMSGDEMLEKVRQTEWGAHPRVIVLTNISRDEAPSSLRLLNIDRYVVKAHTTPSDIVTIVRDILAS